MFQNLYIRVSQDMTKLYYHGFTKGEIDQFENYLRRIFNNLKEFEK